MRYYLNQQIKFWLALMGLFTLVYIHLLGGKGNLVRGKPRSQHTTLVAVQLNAERQLDESVVSVENAEAYAKSIDADYIVLDTDWSNELSKLVLLYPDGIVVVDGTKRLIPSDSILLPLGTRLELLPIVSTSSKSNSRQVALLLKPSDGALIQSLCGRNSGPTHRPPSSTLRSCGNSRIGKAVFTDPVGALLISGTEDIHSIGA